MAIDGAASLASATGTDGTKSEKAQKKLADDLNHFLTLLTTQLQHQDPLEPMDATEFTNQLVQFASVEQQIYANSNLEKLIKTQEQVQLSSVVGYLGKGVETAGSQLPLEGGQARFSYTLEESADKVNILITDAKGTPVHTRQGDAEAGTYDLTWDGKDALGFDQPDGTYKLTVSALDRNGDPVDVVQRVIGTVTGASTENGEPTVYMGDVKVPLDQVIAVREPAASGASGS